MRVIVEIVHPANVLFFLRPIRMLQARGDEVLILSRHKDVACRLLGSLGLQHEPQTTAGQGVFGLARELVVRDINVFRAAKRFRPHVMVGFGGVAISHAGRALGVPSVSFYDTEVATLQTRLTWPFISHLYVPSSYRGKVPSGRVSRVPGIKELSYFHPSSFKPDRRIALENGLDGERDNFLIRVVSWRANHDLGKQGWSTRQLVELVHHLAGLGRVHISTERPIPDEIESFRYKGRADQLHHVIGHSRLYVGESATMACEAAVLGTPSVYASNDFRGYIDELAASGLVRKLDPAAHDDLRGGVATALAEPPGVFAQARLRYLADKPDWAMEVVAALDRHAA